MHCGTIHIAIILYIHAHRDILIATFYFTNLHTHIIIIVMYKSLLAINLQFSLNLKLSIAKAIL